MATLRAWTSLAQWVGTTTGANAIRQVEDDWPGYGDIAVRSILNAYYTDTDVVIAVWDWLERNGIDHGVGFEPGCGRGDWIAAAPTRIRFDAVDIDPMSVTIASALTGANVVESPIESWHLGRSAQRTRERWLRRGGRQRAVLVAQARSRQPAPRQSAQPRHCTVGVDAAPRWSRCGHHVAVLDGFHQRRLAPPPRRRGGPGRCDAVAVADAS